MSLSLLSIQKGYIKTEQRLEAVTQSINEAIDFEKNQ